MKYQPLNPEQKPGLVNTGAAGGELTAASDRCI
jgi:hypothetical protein